ncbi:MAG: PadR family transcriptional regulator [Gemmatimonadaceae bacterium]
MPNGANGQARRPDPVRLTAKEREILKLLIGHGAEMYGLEMVAHSEGRLSRGSIYVLLDRLEERGLVSSRLAERAPGMSGIARRLYQPTGHGRRVLQLWEELQGLASAPSAPLAPDMA